ncbi:MAG: hypothetical protein R3C44_07300 [Chloroflexota bacterium]
MAKIKRHEAELSQEFPSCTSHDYSRFAYVYGITDIEELANRTPTFAVSLDGYSLREVAIRLGEEGIRLARTLLCRRSHGASGEIRQVAGWCVLLCSLQHVAGSG